MLSNIIEADALRIEKSMIPNYKFFDYYEEQTDESEIEESVIETEETEDN